MDMYEKLKILAEAAKYDVSCSSSGSSRKNYKGGIGNASPSGICHTFTSDGRCISLLKILLTNHCIYDCAYCINRSTNDIPRAAFTPSEIAELTINFYRRNYIEGLFLSSAVINNPDYTMELLIDAVFRLRKYYRFNGYIHMKAIPGANPILIRKAGSLADRMSVNIELPSDNSLKLLAPQKSLKKVYDPMSFINKQIIQTRDEQKHFINTPSFVPAGQSTQLIVGATPDSDLNILKLSENLYKKYDLRRVYYSAYIPVSHSIKLPSLKKPPLLREHRLYQADWLLRFYKFSADELLTDRRPNFNTLLDPKTDWALRFIYDFPIEINTAPMDKLLRVPGIGLTSVQRIVNARKVHKLTYDDVRKMGIVLKRAQYFITCGGKYYGDVPFNESLIKERLSNDACKFSASTGLYEQIGFFNNLPDLIH